MRTLNNYNIVIGDTNTIERTCKITEDFRNNDLNIRATIYEVAENKIYTLIVKQNGEVKKVLSAQNELYLLLRTSNIIKNL